MIDRNKTSDLMREAKFNSEDHYAIVGMLLRFADLVAAAEREACAQLCDIRETMFKGYKTDGLAALCAAAIRARGNHEPTARHH